MGMITSGLCLALCLICCCFGQEEMFNNPGFEEPFTNNDWICNGQCTISQSTDAYAGQYSGYISGRSQDWNGVSQWVSIEAGSTYRFRAYLKVLTLVPGYLWHEINMVFLVEFADGSTQTQWFGRLPYSRPDWGWQEIGGDISLDDSREITRGSLRVQLSEDISIEYLIDEATLTKVVENRGWKAEADDRIAQIRKEDVTVSINTDNTCDPQLVEVKYDHFHHDFPFGTAVKALLIAGTTERDQKYQQTFYDNFNWAVLENSLKWRQMEPNQGTINFERTDNALDELEKRNIPVRGHAVFWDKVANNPNWLQNGYEGEAMRAELRRRMDYTVPHYSGRLAHWDVNNEQTHGDWYEQMIGDHEVMDWMFEEVAKLDPDCLLFLNDFAVVRDGERTLAFTNSAKNLLAAGKPLDALGLQSHIRLKPDIALFTDRLDTMASAGLPMWITEMDIENVDVDVRADAYEDTLRLYFSRPEIEGILLWGFWNEEHSKPDAALFDGPDLTPNAAGLRWQYLLNQEWSTHATFYPRSDVDTRFISSFYGNYTVDINYNGELHHQRYFYVGKDQTNELVIQVNDCQSKKGKGKGKRKPKRN